MTRICLISALVGLCFLEAATIEAPTRRATVVVRADPRSGRLVRSVVVSARILAPKVVQPRAAGGNRPAAFPADTRVDQLIEEAARRHNVDPLLVHSVIRVESNYNPFAISHKGAEGLMQLIPSTARRFGVRNTFNPGENIEAGVRYLRYLKDLFQDDRLALAAYNAGEAAVMRYGWIPPYRETQNYVFRVGKKYGELRKAAGTVITKPVDPRQETAQQYRPVESHVDSEGRLHLRTR